MSLVRPSVSDLQRRAWSFYGYPGEEHKAVGEVRYVAGWHADQMTRLEWDVFIGGSDVWRVDLGKDEGAITTTRPGPNDAEGNATVEEDQTAASAELLALIDWTDSNIRAVDTNLIVGGSGDYVNTGEEWRVVSPVDRDRKALLDAAEDVVPFIFPHPADPAKPDAPLFSVLGVLDELDWLNQQARTQSKQRVLISGIVGIAEGLMGPDKSDFWKQWNDTLSARMADPDDLSPVRLSGTLDLVKDGLNWTVPDFGYDAVIDRRVLAAIHRLAYGLPIPPEILLGMQAQSRATAFQVEENAYRAHIEPLALLVAQVAQDALNLLLDRDDVEVVPNPSKMLARKNSVEDVKWANAEGLVDDEYTLEVLGIPPDAAPDSGVAVDPAVKAALDMAVAAPSLAQAPGLPALVEQIRQVMGEGGGVPSSSSGAPIATDPANDAADEPVAAALSADSLSDLLADMDFQLSSELVGATVMATDRARQRLGAAARSNQAVRTDKKLKELRQSELASELGVDGLNAAGVDIDAQIAEPVAAASEWWVRRIGQAWEQAATLVPGWSGQGAWVDESVDVLATALSQHVVESLSEPLAPLEADKIRAVVDAAAGGS